MTIMVSIKEFAELTGIGINRLREMTKITGFPAMHSGRHTLIHKDDAVNWLRDYVKKQSTAQGSNRLR